jgi:hypothetical protein
MFAALVAAVGCGSERDTATARAAKLEMSEHAAPGAEAPGDIEEALDSIVATCARARGVVEVKRRGKTEWEAVAVGATFRSGDWIRVGAGASARVQFLGNTALELEQNTTIQVDEAPAAAPGGKPGAVIAVETGVARGIVDKDRAAEDPPLFVAVDSGKPARVVPAAGEVEFRLTRVGEQTELAVSRGSLSLISDGGTERTLSSGEAVDVQRDRIGEVSRLVGFPVSVSPGVDARFHHSPDRTIELAWRRVKGADGYRVQIARDLSFHEIVFVGETDDVDYAFTPPDVGTYIWRIAAIDERGRVGEWGFGRRIFCEARPPRDILLSPRNGVKIPHDGKPPAIVFSWQSAGEVTSYRLVVGRGANPLDSKVVDKVTTAQSIEVSSLRDGKYSWGVYSRGDDAQPLFLSPRRLTVVSRSAPRARTNGIWE